jgi:quinol monooxygenase YgiN
VIHVIAVVEVAPGKRDGFLTEFRKVMPLVRAEAGCLEYAPALDLPTDIPTQVPARENVVTVVEKWESLAALHAHLRAPHMAEYRARVKELVVGTGLQILQPA